MHKNIHGFEIAYMEDESKEEGEGVVSVKIGSIHLALLWHQLFHLQIALLRGGSNNFSDNDGIVIGEDELYVSQSSEDNVRVTTYDGSADVTEEFSISVEQAREIASVLKEVYFCNADYEDAA